MQVLEGRSMSEIECLNLYFTQAAATLEYDGAVVQDLLVQLSWVLMCIDVLKACPKQAACK